MALVITDVLDHVVSHALASGWFEKVNQHEPKNAPGHGITCAVWVDKVVPARSGLDITSAQITFNVRLYQNMITEPQDAIDVNLMNAMNALMVAYSGDFTFDGTVYAVDLLGMEGAGLQAEAGYVEQDKKMLRVVTITLPVTVNDVWTQTA